jgi:hypothetical protein
MTPVGQAAAVFLGYCFLFSLELVSFFSCLLRWLLLCCQIQKIQTLLWGNFSIPFRSTLIMHIEKFSVHICDHHEQYSSLGNHAVLTEAITFPLEIFVASGGHVNVALSFVSPCEINGIVLSC